MKTMSKSSKAIPSTGEVVADKATGGIELPAPEDQNPGMLESEWNAHEFRVVKDEDISFLNRSRRRVSIVAPDALTQEDRTATLMEAALLKWREHHAQFIIVSLLPFEPADFSIARLDYAPDKCGISGDECTGKVWTYVNASNVIITPEQEQVYTARMGNRDRFKEFDRTNGFKVLNEGRLKAFLAEKFKTTPEDISRQLTAVFLSQLSTAEMSIPHQLALRGHLSEQDQRLADETACQASCVLG